MAKAKIKSIFQYNFSKTLEILIVLFLIGCFPLIAKGAQEEELCEVKLPDIEEEYAPGEVLVKFKHGIREEKQKEVCQALGVSMLKKIPSIDVHLLSIPAEKKVPEMIGLFRKHPFVEYAEPNYRRYKTVTIPNDTYFSSQWALSQTSDHDIGAPEAWDITTGDSSIIIAIIDDGIDYIHEEFLSPKLWINPATGEPGYDFGGSNRDKGKYVPDDDVMHESGSGHGTATSGIAAGLTNNAKGIAGTSWLPTIMPLKVEDGALYIYDSYIANAITFAVDNGAYILSMSLGGSSPSSTLENACQYAWENGKVIVASSGNENTSISYPARFSTTIAVGATNEIDNRIYVGNPGNNWSSGGSNYGPELDVVAPGINIYATDWSASGEGYGAGAYIPNFGGTSASCPFVSGECALLLSEDTVLPNERVRSIIQSSAQDQVGESIEDTPGFDIYYGYGRINLYNALSSPTKPDLTLSSSAGDIGFSNETPLPGETITISATIHNNGSMYDEVNPIPFASVLQNTGSGFYVDARFSVAQSFTATTDGWLGEVALAMKDQGTNSSYAQIEIQTNSGSNTPSGTVVSSTETQDWPVDYVTSERIEFSNPAKLTAGTKYWIVVTCSDSYQNGYLWGFNNGSVYAGGGKSGKDNTASPPTWESESTTNDCQFKVYLSNYNTIVKFYNGDPSAGGTQINNDQALSPIPSSGTGTASVDWTVTSGIHDIWVVIDPANSIPESNENNNKDYKTITVGGTVLSILVSPTSWSVGQVEPGSVTTMTIANNILVQNDGNVNETFTLQVTNTGGTWSAATIENGNTENTFVMSGLFTTLIDSIVANDFNEGLDDDVIITANPKSATSTTFGCSKSTGENGVAVPPSEARYLWLQFKAPSSSSVTTQQTIIVTVGAEQTP